MENLTVSKNNGKFDSFEKQQKIWQFRKTTENLTVSKTTENLTVSKNNRKFDSSEKNPENLTKNRQKSSYCPPRRNPSIVSNKPLEKR
jgi:hypothetical protein